MKRLCLVGLAVGLAAVLCVGIVALSGKRWVGQARDAADVPYLGKALVAQGLTVKSPIRYWIYASHRSYGAVLLAEMDKGDFDHLAATLSSEPLLSYEDTACLARAKWFLASFGRKELEHVEKLGARFIVQIGYIRGLGSIEAQYASEAGKVLIVINDACPISTVGSSGGTSGGTDRKNTPQDQPTDDDSASGSPGPEKGD